MFASLATALLLATPAILATPVGIICDIMPVQNPDPFVSYPAAPPVGAKLLSNTNGYATLDDESFSTSWNYGAEQAISAWVTKAPCGGFIFLNVAAGTPEQPFRALTWDQTWTSTWNATVGKDLVSVDYNSSQFVACKLVNPAAKSPTWVLLLQINQYSIGLPTSATTAAGTISTASCVRTKIGVM